LKLLGTSLFLSTPFSYHDLFLEAPPPLQSRVLLFSVSANGLRKRTPYVFPSVSPRFFFFFPPFHSSSLFPCMFSRAPFLLFSTRRMGFRLRMVHFASAWSSPLMTFVWRLAHPEPASLFLFPISYFFLHGPSDNRLVIFLTPKLFFCFLSFVCDRRI